MNVNLSGFKYNQHGTSHWRLVRLVISLVALGAIAYGIGHMTRLKWSQVENFFKGKIAAWKMATIVSSISVTAVVLAIIFHKATRGKDSAYDKLNTIHDQVPGRGKFWGDQHWVPIKITRGNDRAANDFILDTSTLDNNGKGACFAYNHKPCSMAEVIAVETALAVPIYIPAVAIYHLLAWPLAAYKNKTNPICELGKSLWRVVQSPFYGLAYFIALLYVLIDPRNGRKLAANIERDWNKGALLENSCWIANGSHKYNADKQTGMDLGRNNHGGFYITGCFQPVAVIQVEGYQVQSAKLTNGHETSLQIEQGWSNA